MDKKIFQEALSLLGQNVKSLREILDLTQLELAKQAGVSRTVIALFEQGKRMPHVINLLKICDALHVTPAELFAQSLTNWVIDKNARERAELHKSLRKTMCKTLSR